MKSVKKDMLHELNLDWQDMFERMSIGFAVRRVEFDKNHRAVDFKYEEANQTFAKITGFSREKILNTSAKTLVPKLSRAWFEKYEKLLKDGKPIVFEQKEGSMGKTFRVYAFKMGSDLVGTVFLDITILESVEKLIRESESKYQAIVKSSQDSIVMMDDKGNITAWNPAAERIFGYSQEEAMGKNLHDLITAEKEHREKKTNLNKFFQTGESPVLGKVLTLPVKNKNGKVFLIELTVSATEINGRWFAVGIMRDISERKKMEDELEEKMRMAEMLNKITVDRELRMIELKKEISNLKKNGK